MQLIVIAVLQLIFIKVNAFGFSDQESHKNR